MNRPTELKGVVHGKTITLDEDPILPDGYRATLHLILQPGEGLDLSFGGWANITDDQLAELEEILSDSRGRPVSLRDGDLS
jgi:hypothetical protein